MKLWIIIKKTILFLLVFLMLSLLTTRMIIYHPYQNIYFNFFIKAEVKKGFDPWKIVHPVISFLKKILANNKDKKIIVSVASYLPLERSLALLKKNDRNRIKIVGQEYLISDYIFTNNISEVNKNFDNKYNIPKKFIKVDKKLYKENNFYKLQRINENIYL